jgi:putative flippase GtrA
VRKNIILNQRFASFKVFISQFLKFGIIGVLATICHTIFFYFLISATMLPIFLSNFLSFILALNVSFFGNFFFTFSKLNSLKIAMIRFFLVAIAGFLINNLSLLFLLNFSYFPKILIAIIPSLISSTFVFSFARLWVYKDIK